MNSNNGASCPICFQGLAVATSESNFVAMKCCNIGICHSCLTKWFEVCEQTGQPMPTCPQCRQCVEPTESAKVLGRPFVPAGSSSLDRHSAATDEATRAGGADDDDDLSAHLIASMAKSCASCGAWIVKEDGCGLMQCLCGYRFCWDCGTPGGRSCGCTPAHHAFHDNVCDRPYFTFFDQPSRVATNEELQDLYRFLETQRLRERLDLRRLLPQKTDEQELVDKMLWVQAFQIGTHARPFVRGSPEEELRDLRHFLNNRKSMKEIVRDIPGASRRTRAKSFAGNNAMPGIDRLRKRRRGGNAVRDIDNNAVE